MVSNDKSHRLIFFCFLLFFFVWIENKTKPHLITDIFFAGQVFIDIDWTNVDVASLTMFCLCVCFILMPMFINFYQLHEEIQIWITDIETRRTVQAWIQLHLRSLYLLSIALGSCFTAVELSNSNLFRLSVFNMGLNRRQKAIFKNQRVFSTVLVENVPQLLLQIIYSIVSKSVTYVTIIAALFSLVSIILSVFEHISASLLLKTESVTIIRLDVISQDIGRLRYKEFDDLTNYRRVITRQLSRVIDVDFRVIELLLPTQTKDGVTLTFHIRSHVDKNNRSINTGDDLIGTIKKEAQSGELAKVENFVVVLSCFHPLG